MDILVDGIAVVAALSIGSKEQGTEHMSSPSAIISLSLRSTTSTQSRPGEMHPLTGVNVDFLSIRILLLTRDS